MLKQEIKNQRTYIFDTLSNVYIGYFKNNNNDNNILLINTFYTNEKELTRFTGYDENELKDNINYYFKLNNKYNIIICYV